MTNIKSQKAYNIYIYVYVSGTVHGKMLLDHCFSNGSSVKDNEFYQK